MSFSATFYFDNGPNEGHQVVRFNHGFVQGIDDKGQPSTDVRSSMVGVRIILTHDNELIKWMFDPYSRRNARMIFKRSDQDSTFIEIRFEEAYCVFYQDSLIARGDKNASATVDIYLTPRKVISRGVEFDAEWEA